MGSEMDDGAEIHEFFRVARLVPDNQDIISVPVGTLVRDALSLMKTTGYSQLPVLAGSTVIGVFSYRSLARALSNIRKQDDPLDARVEDATEDLTFVHGSDEVGKLLSYFDRDGAVLVGSEDALLAVTTATDALMFFWQTARPFVLLQDIELAVRELMRRACSEGELVERIAAAGVTGAGGAEASDVAELTLGDMITTLTNGENFGQCFQRTFGSNRTLVLSQLEPVRDIRNQVLHFRDPASVDQVEVLIGVAAWLRRRILVLRAGS
jgi:CBS domain-containing protein